MKETLSTFFCKYFIAKKMRGLTKQQIWFPCVPDRLNVKERKIERERGWKKYVWVWDTVCVCACVRVCACVCVWVRKSAREKERERMYVVSMSVCVKCYERERERWCVCVCVCVCVWNGMCVWVWKWDSFLIAKEFNIVWKDKVYVTSRHVTLYRDDNIKD